MNQVAAEIDVECPHGGGYGNQNHRKAVDETNVSGRRGGL
jgi:hypothetical protein